MKAANAKQREPEAPAQVQGSTPPAEQTAPPVGISGVTAEALREFGVIDVAPSRDARCVFAFVRLPAGYDFEKKQKFLAGLQQMIEQDFFSLGG
jgi:hypothetical protein